jgi:hypothetical protein
VLEADAELMAAGGIAPLHQLMTTCDVYDVASGVVRSESDASRAEARAMLDEVASSPEERTLVLRRVGTPAKAPKAPNIGRAPTVLSAHRQTSTAPPHIGKRTNAAATVTACSATHQLSAAISAAALLCF